MKRKMKRRTLKKLEETAKKLDYSIESRVQFFIRQLDKTGRDNMQDKYTK